MDAVWWKWLDINYGSKPCVERAWWDLLEVVKMVRVSPADIYLARQGIDWNGVF